MTEPLKSLYELKTEDLGHRLSWLVLTQEQFSKEVGPYLGFTRDQLLDMLSAADDANEGLPISTDRKNYFLPPDEVKNFFKVNEKPRRAMSVKEENTLLKRQTAELEAEVARLRGANVEPPKKAFTYPEALGAQGSRHPA